MIVLLAVVFAGIRVSSGVRAYVGAESLWSKAQKQGVASLYRYAVTRDEADFEAYRRAQRIPDADRRARLELQGERQDRGVAVVGFIEGGNYPSDATVMVWVFQHLGNAPYVRQAIELRRLIRAGTPMGPELGLALDRIAAVDERLTHSESNFSATLADGARWLNRVIGEGIALVTQAEDHLPPVEADPGQLSQVILNLVLNARDAMPHGGEVRIRTYARPAAAPKSSSESPPASSGGWTVIEVTDQGAGMEEEVRERIFEPFYTTKEIGKGTGLGLATVYGIVANLGGLIEVRTAPGAGSTFTVRLPSRAWPDPTALPRLLSSATRAPESISCSLMWSCLSWGGRALSLAMRERAHLVPVVFMSGYTADADPLLCPTGERAELLAKPFAPADLAAVVRRVLDRSRDEHS